MVDETTCAYCSKEIPDGAEFSGVEYNDDPTLYEFCSIECAQYWSNGENSPTAKRNIQEWHASHK